VLDPIDIIDGIALEDLVVKRTSNLMQPHLAGSIEKQTRKEFADGIPGYGTDALRFTFASLASTGRDIRFDLKRVEGYRNFCNKLYNASRYVLMNTEGLDAANIPAERNAIDRWIISRLQQTEQAVAAHIEEYRFDLAATALYEFVWNEYCDWYLELAKPTLSDDSTAEAQQATRITLVRVLEATLRLAHPFIPFITEELWHQVAPRAGISGPTISLQTYPIADPERIDQAALDEIDWVKRVVVGVRKIRSEMNINPGKRLPLFIVDASDTDQQRLAEHIKLLTFLARLESITLLAACDDKPDAAVALIDHMQLLIPMAGLIDKEAELARLGKELERLEKEIKRLSAKLDNPGFTSKAPAAVVAAEQQKLADARAAIAQLAEQKDRIAGL
jgi:valyl-tRNA synthetase